MTIASAFARSRADVPERLRNSSPSSASTSELRRNSSDTSRRRAQTDEDAR